MKRWTALLAAAVLAAAGCALTPEAENSLVQARAAYAAAQSDPDVAVARFAPTEIAEAGRRISRVEAAAPGADSDWVRHQAYLAEQQVHIARHRAMARAAEAELAQAGEERERVLARLRQARQSRDTLAKEHAEVQKLNAEVQALRQRLEDQKALEELRAQRAQLKARETDRGWVLTVGGDVVFDQNQTTLKPGARRSLEGLARFLRAHPAQQVLIEGFTDNPGSEEMNQSISEMRAAAVKDALVEQGVSPDRIATRGFGEAYPIASNATPAGRQLNRRVEIVISQGAQASAGR